MANKPKAILRIALTDECLETKIDEFGLSFRTENALKRAGYFTIKDIRENPEGLIHVKNCGINSRKELFRKIIQRNIDTLNGANPWVGIRIEHWEDKPLWN